MQYRQINDPRTKQISSLIIYRVDDDTTIPIDAANADYQAFLDWVKEGGNILPPEASNAS